MFQLPAAQGSLEPQVMAVPTVPVACSVLAVGRAYLSTLRPVPELVLAPIVDPRKSTATEVKAETKKDAQYEKLMKADLGDYYALLGLEDLGLDATEEDIRKAHRNLSMVCHPDKAALEDRQRAEDRYKAMQVAFESLVDPVRRRAYDSSLDFDDAIPSDKQGNDEKTFFSVYGPVFARNERFSSVKPVPKLGTMDTPMDDVNNFYDFWYSFKSWRDFAYLDEHKVESAQGRDEKRWMIRENQKKQAGKKKEEAARVRKLVEDAQRKDPRIARQRRELEEQRNKGKYAKQEAARLKAEAEAKAKAEAEAKAKEDAERKAKEDAERKELREKLKKSRNTFGKVCKAAGLNEDDIEKLRPLLELHEIDAINDAFKKDAQSAEGKELFNKHFKMLSMGEEEKQRLKEESAAEARYKARKAEEDAMEAKTWTNGEEQALTKAVVKYPGGTVQRWEKITEAVNAVGHRTMKEVIHKAKSMELSPEHHTDQDEAYSKWLDKMNEKKDKDEKSRTANLALEEKRKREEEEKKIANAAAAAASSIAKSSGDDAIALALAKAQATAARAKAEAEAELHGNTSNTKKKEEEKEEWTSDEQDALEKAMKSVSKDAADRWDQIAVLVKTKNKKQCIARFKEIRDAILKQRGDKA